MSKCACPPRCPKTNAKANRINAGPFCSFPRLWPSTQGWINVVPTHKFPMGQIESGQPSSPGSPTCSSANNCRRRSSMDGEWSVGGLSTSVDLLVIQNVVLQETQVLLEVAKLTYDDLREQVAKLNTISRILVDDQNKQLFFIIKKGSDESVLWKATVRIICAKTDCATQNVEAWRALNLKQFLKLCKTLHNHASFSGHTAAERVKPPIASASEHLLSESILRSPLLTQSLLDEASGETPNADECCICMERKAGVILPCTHEYCLVCIEQWNVNNKSCPQCRETLESTDDTWVLSDAPSSPELLAEMRKALFSVFD